MCFRAVKYLPPRQSYWLYLIHPLSCLPPIYIDYSSMSWLRSKMAAALPQWRCYSLITIWDFSLCEALGLLCLWQMLSYVHELSYKPMMCFSPSSPLSISVHICVYIMSGIYLVGAWLERKRQPSVSKSLTSNSSTTSRTGPYHPPDHPQPLLVKSHRDLHTLTYWKCCRAVKYQPSSQSHCTYLINWYVCVSLNEVIFE